MTVYYICPREAVLRTPSELGSTYDYDHVGYVPEWKAGNESNRLSQARRSSRLEAALLYPEIDV